jgi:EmrB/QacA subfamily drug resistance transporter
LKEVPVRDHRRSLVLGLLCSVQFVLVLDVTIVAVALPSLRDGLGFSADGLQWVISAYVLAFAGFLLLGGRAADLWGRRRLFLAGLAAFAGASAWCGLAAASWQLVTARAVQGVGAAVVAPAALSLLTTTFAEGAERERALGVWTAAAAGGGATGFLLGGVLTQALGWRAVFLVNVPVGAAGLLLGRVLPAGREPAAPRRLDLPGAVTLTGGLVALVYALSRVERAGAGPRPAAVWLPLAAAAVLGGAFVARERRAANPLVPLGVLRVPALAGASLVAMLLTAVTTPAVLFCILYVQDLLGYPPTLVGLTVVPFSVAVVVGSLAGGRLADAGRLGSRRAMAAGLVGVALGAAALATMGTSRGFPLALVAGFVLSGAGLGVASVASTAAGTGAVPAAQQGLASGLLNTAAQVGNAVGLAALVTVASARTGALTPAGAAPPPAAVVEGYRWAILAGLAVTLAAAAALAAVPAAATARRGGRRPSRRRAPPPGPGRAGRAWPAPGRRGS